MAIFRRIFRKHYKRRTKPRTVFFNNKIKLEIKHNKNKFEPLQMRKKLRTAPLRKSLSINNWNSLTRENRLREQVFAQHDIHIFAKQYTPRHALKTDANTFQPYLPANVWKKMSKQQRQEHLQKRNELVKKGVKFSKPQYKKVGYKAYFTNAKNRPILKNMSNSTKINYLKVLISRAKILGIKIHQEIEPEISKNRPNKIKIPPIRQHLANFNNIINYNSIIKLTNHLVPKKFNKKKHG